MEVHNIDTRSLPNDINKFLNKVCRILQDTSNFILKRNRRNEKANPKYTTETCLLELEYDTEDVINEIKSLSLNHYYQTLFDDKGRGHQPIYVFIKTIQKKQVYIKIQLKERVDGEKVVCISFHYAEHEISKLPYAK